MQQSVPPSHLNLRPLRVLIIGAGIAGPSVAYWLTRLPPPFKCEITIAERHPTLRDAGQQIDIRGPGIKVMQQMGIDEQVRACAVDEPGVLVLNRKGKKVAFFAAGGIEKKKGGETKKNESKAFSAEWEVMRNDLVNVLYDLTKDREGVKYQFEKEFVAMGYEGHPLGPEKGVKVWFKQDLFNSETYDLVIGADGVGSKVRGWIRGSGEDKDDVFDAVDMAMAFFTIPGKEDDPKEFTWCHLPGRRLIMTRHEKPEYLRVIFAVVGDHPELREAHKNGSVQQQKEAWAKLFEPDRNKSWQVARYLDGLFNSTEANDWWAHDLAQVKMKKWSWAERAVLVGDAGYCPTPATGMGTTLAFVGAYILGGEIARACKKVMAEGKWDGNPWSTTILPEALEGYESQLRPLVTEIHSLNIKKFMRLFLPKKAWQIGLFHAMARFIKKTPIDNIPALGKEGKKAWRLPDYSEVFTPEGQKPPNGVSQTNRE